MMRPSARPTGAGGGGGGAAAAGAAAGAVSVQGSEKGHLHMCHVATETGEGGQQQQGAACSSK